MFLLIVEPLFKKTSTDPSGHYPLSVYAVTADQIYLNFLRDTEKCSISQKVNKTCVMEQAGSKIGENLVSLIIEGAGDASDRRKWER